MGDKNGGDKIFQVNSDDSGQNHNFSLVPTNKSSSVGKPLPSLDNFGHDLLLQIFLRLPDCQSAIRCLAVSKLWYSLISDRHFICSFIHRQQLSNPGSTLYTLLVQFSTAPISAPFYAKSFILHPRRPPSFLSSNFLSLLPFPFIGRAYFKDLLLVSDWSRFNTSHYICNVLTRKFIALPDAPENDFALPNATRCQSTRVALAWKCATDEQWCNYRVVLIAALSNTRQFIMKIFSFETGKWDMVMVSSPQWLLPDIGDWNMHVVVFANGMLHWIDGRDLIYGIFAFDPFDDNTRPKSVLFIHRPPELPSGVFKRNEICFGSCQGRLRISYSLILPLQDLFIVRVWELMNYENNAETWCLKHNIVRTRNLGDTHIHERRGKKIHVVGFHPNDGDVVFLSHMNHIYEHNLLTSRSKKIGDFPAWEMEFRKFFPLVHPFWPTQVPTFRSI